MNASRLAPAVFIVAVLVVLCSGAAYAQVAVNPQLSISPSAGPRGTTFSQPGQGFTPNSTATVYYRKPDGVLYPPVRQPTDGQGRYTRQWTAPPEGQAGRYQAWAVDDRTGRQSPIVSYTVTAPPISSAPPVPPPSSPAPRVVTPAPVPSAPVVVVNPQLSNSPSVGPRGTTFSQPGQGFTPNSTATVHYRKPDGVEYPPLIQPTDGQGRYMRQWTAPPEAQTGMYQAWAVDNRTGLQSSVISYTVTAPPMSSAPPVPPPSSPAPRVSTPAPVPSAPPVVVNPQLWISPSAGPRGTTFSQPGQGFTPNSTATVHYRKPDGVEYPPLIQPTDGQGRYMRQWTAPPEAQTGMYQAWAVDNRTGRQSPVISYTVIAQTVLPGPSGTPAPGGAPPPATTTAPPKAPAPLTVSADRVILSEYSALSQLDPRIYRDPALADRRDAIPGGGGTSAVKNLACAATVYVMLARGRGYTAAMVDDFYQVGPGAIRPAVVSGDVAFDSSQVVRALRARQPVVLHGYGGPLKEHFVLAVGFEISGGRLSITALDPYPLGGGIGPRPRINIDGATGRHPDLDVTFASMRLVGAGSIAATVLGTNPAPAPLAVAATSAPAPAPSVYEATVRRAYLDVLRREPDAGGLATYTEALRAGRLTEATLRTTLQSSEEYRRRFGPPAPTQAPTGATPAPAPPALAPSTAPKDGRVIVAGNRPYRVTKGATDSRERSFVGQDGQIVKDPKLRRELAVATWVAEMIVGPYAPENPEAALLAMRGARDVYLKLRAYKAAQDVLVRAWVDAAIVGISGGSLGAMTSVTGSMLARRMTSQLTELENLSAAVALTSLEDAQRDYEKIQSLLAHSDPLDTKTAAHVFDLYRRAAIPRHRYTGLLIALTPKYARDLVDGALKSAGKEALAFLPGADQIAMSEAQRELMDATLNVRDLFKVVGAFEGVLMGHSGFEAFRSGDQLVRSLLNGADRSVSLWAGGSNVAPPSSVPR